MRLLGAPGRILGELNEFANSYQEPLDEIATRLRSLGQMAWWKLVPASETPLNGPVGPHRAVDWMKLPLEDLKALRKKLDCSVNDLVLAVVTGAVRDFMLDRRVDPSELEFRVAAPVNVRRDDHQGKPGNHVSSWIVRLPLGVADPLEQVAEIHHTTQELKKSQQAAAVELVEAVHEWLPFDIQSMSSGTQNMFVTNVPGPPFPLYMLGAELEEIYVQAPLIENLGLVIAAISYNGTVFWGFNGDPDRVPDIGRFVEMARSSYARLTEAAGLRSEETRPIVVGPARKPRASGARKSTGRKSAARAGRAKPRGRGRKQ
jgi:WS/DGAT/MGAT family acyltransferase